MRKLTKKISMLMVLAMLVGLFSGVVSASAASKWSFKSNDGDYTVAPGETINLDQNQYEKFILSKDGANAADYTITWESSDADVVFVNAKTGQLRANKAAADGAEAVITGNIVNVNTKKTHKVSFNIVVGEVKSDYTLQAPKFTESQEIGKEIKFSTNVLDKDGKNVSFKDCGLYRAYFIDGKAIANPWTPTEAKEYTITVGAFTAKAATADLNNALLQETFKVNVRPEKAAIATVEQVKLNTIRVIFNDASFATKALVAVQDDIEKVFELTFNADKDDNKGGQRVDHELYKAEVDPKNPNAIIITAYKPLTENLTYKIAYLEDGKEVAYDWIVGTGSIPASIEVAEIGYTIDEYKSLVYVVKNKEKVEITDWYDKDIYPVEWELVSDQTADFDLQTIDGTICFMKKDAKATVKITLDMGFEDNGAEIADLTDKGTVYGTDKRATTALNDYQITKGGNVAWNGWKNSTSAFEFFVGEGDGDSQYLQLLARYTKTAKDGTVISWAPITIKEGSAVGDEDNDKVYTYQSSNTDIVAVDEALGYVYPVAPGTAKVYIKEDGNVIGYATVKVHKEPVFTTFKVGIIGDDKLSVIADEAGMDEQQLKFSVIANDQLGNSLLGDVDLSFEIEKEFVDPADKTVKYDLYDLFDQAAFDNISGWDYGVNANFGVIKADEDGPFAIDSTVGLLTKGVAKSIKVKATAVYTNDDGEEKKMYGAFSFKVKWPDASKTNGPQLVIENIDTTLGVNNVKGVDHGNYDGSIKVVEKDLQGYFVRKIAIADVFEKDIKDVLAAEDADAATAVSAGCYTITVTKGDYALDSKYVEEQPIITQTSDYNTYVDGLWVEDDIAGYVGYDVLVKADKGTYKVRLYKGNGTKAVSVDADSLKITDSTPAITTTKVAEKISDWETIEGLCDSLQFIRNGKKLDMKTYAKNLSVEWDYKQDDSNRIYIYKVKFLLNVDAYYGDFADGYYTL